MPFSYSFSSQARSCLLPWQHRYLLHGPVHVLVTSEVPQHAPIQSCLEHLVPIISIFIPASLNALILTRFRFAFSKVQLTPLAMDHGLTAPPLDEPFESSGLYLELVGCLMYLMTCTRPDLAYPLSVLASFVAPGRHRPSHWYTTKRVAKHVASTSGI
ncbi:unnamed protein product [Closterium sp. NIES-53]